MSMQRAIVCVSQTAAMCCRGDWRSWVMGLERPCQLCAPSHLFGRTVSQCTWSGAVSTSPLDMCSRVCTCVCTTSSAALPVSTYRCDPAGALGVAVDTSRGLGCMCCAATSPSLKADPSCCKSHTTGDMLYNMLGWALTCVGDTLQRQARWPAGSWPGQTAVQ
jgi:hypothetical protein